MELRLGNFQVRSLGDLANRRHKMHVLLVAWYRIVIGNMRASLFMMIDSMKSFSTNVAPLVGKSCLLCSLM